MNNFLLIVRPLHMKQLYVLYDNMLSYSIDKQDETRLAVNDNGMWNVG